MRWYSALLSSGPTLEYSAVTGDRILVIEDSLCLQNALTKVLKKASPFAEVDWATTADEVRSGINQTNLRLDELYSLVISDIILPGMSGIEFYRICQDHFPRLNFLMMSGMGAQEYLDAFHSHCGPTPPLLQKPFSMEQCNQMISGLLKGL